MEPERTSEIVNVSMNAVITDITKITSALMMKLITRFEGYHVLQHQQHLSIPRISD